MAIMDVTILRLPNMQVGEQPTHIYGDEGGERRSGREQMKWRKAKYVVGIIEVL